MKHIKQTVILLLFILVLFACNQKKNKTETVVKSDQTSLTDDTTKLENLTKKLYEWNETKSTNVDFSPLQTKEDTVYTDLDLERHKQRMEELKESNLFAEEFIENYNKIALTINEKLQNNTLKWYTGELPPFGNGANPWCNCQDSPDKYWKDITISNLAINEHTAAYTWSWGENFECRVKAVKENGDWKISYLQGFDFNDFIATND